MAPHYPHTLFKSLTQAKTPPTSSNLSAPLQTQTSAGFWGPFGDGALQRAAVPTTECVSIADCCDARREGPHYDMMKSAALLGLHDLTVALPQIRFLLVSSPRLVQSTSYRGHIASDKIHMMSFHMTSSTSKRNCFRRPSAHQKPKCKANYSYRGPSCI